MRAEIIKPQFLPELREDYLQLSDVVLVYSDGKNWKVVPMKVAEKYPIMRDVYFDNNQKASDITFTFCPHTLSSVIYFGKYSSIVNEVYKNNMTIVNEKTPDLMVIQMSGKTYSKNGGNNSKTLVENFIRKNEVKIMTLRNVIGIYTDCVYLYHDIPDTGSTLSISTTSTTSAAKYHPKTFVYGITYNSKHVTEHKQRHSVIVSNDASKDKVNSYDIRINKYHGYFKNTLQKIRDKGGFITPCYWFAWNAMFEESKVVKI